MTPSPTTPQGAEPREDGWIEWTGGENPVPGARVDVRCRNGMVMEDCGDVSWSHPAFAEQLGSGPPSQGDIIAYRVVSPAPDAPTNGGGGDQKLIDDLRHVYSQMTPSGLERMDSDGAAFVIERAIRALQPQPTQQGGAGALNPIWPNAVKAMLDRFDRAKGKGGYPTANEREAMRRCLAALNTQEARG